MENNFTLQYFQPSEYQFSLDSIALANEIVTIIKKRGDLQNLKFVDICCGCGVVGLEVYFYLRDITNFHFIDVQEVYRQYFEKNLKLFAPVPNFTFETLNYKSIPDQYPPQSFDIVISNPPYFFLEEGILSPSEFKNRCRFYMDASYEELIRSMTYLLKPGGEAFLQMMEGRPYKKNRIQEALNYIAPGCVLEVPKMLRASHFMHIKRSETIA